jgi:hypothetical protein
MMKMQAKDIPEKPILAFLAKIERGETFWYPTEPMRAGWGEKNAYSSGTWYEGFENSVLNAMPPGTPPKVALAKIRAMIKKGLVDGCGCGCRGDFNLTPIDLRATLAMPQTYAL